MLARLTERCLGTASKKKKKKPVLTLHRLNVSQFHRLNGKLLLNPWLRSKSQEKVKVISTASPSPQTLRIMSWGWAVTIIK